MVGVVVLARVLARAQLLVELVAGMHVQWMLVTGWEVALHVLVVQVTDLEVLVRVLAVV